MGFPIRVAAVASILLVAACKKSSPPESARMPMPHQDSGTPAEDANAQREKALDRRFPGDSAAKASMRRQLTDLDALGDAETRLAELRHKTLVAPAPAGFKAEPVDRKIRLQLFVDKNKVKVGEFPRLRLELTNTGRKTIDYSENRSSLFVGNLIDSSVMTIRLTDSRGNKIELMPSSTSGRPGRSTGETLTPPPGLATNDQAKWLADRIALGQAHATFKIKLMPGETVHSLGDGDSPVENFKTLQTDTEVERPGKYRLQVVYDDRPAPLTEQDIKDASSYWTPEQTRKEYAARVHGPQGLLLPNPVTPEVVK